MNDDKFYDSFPPHDLAAESCVIGSFILGDEETRLGIAKILPRKESFFSADNAEIYDVLLAMQMHGCAIDGVTVQSEMIQRGTLVLIGGAKKLVETFTSVPSARNWKHYATTVRSCWQLRWGSQQCLNAAKMCFNPCSNAIEELTKLNVKIDKLLTAENAQRSSRTGGAYELKKSILKKIHGQLRVESLSIKKISRSTQMLMPGTVSLIAGPPGDGKTFLILDAMNEFFDRGVPSCMKALEGTREYLLNRLLAIRASEPRLLDNEETERMGSHAVAIHEEHEEAMEAIGQRIFDPSHGETDIGSLARFVEEQSRTNRVIFIDPITLMDKGERVWDDDKTFMKSLDRSASRTGCSIVLITHPKDTQGKPISLNSFPGGKSYIQAAQTALSMQLIKPKDFRVIAADGHPETVREIIRVMTVLKARNGKNCQNMQYALTLNPQTMRFEEHGSILGEEKHIDIPEV